MMKKAIKKLLAALLAVAMGVRHGDPRVCIQPWGD